jgi:hypothetical protein
MNENKMYSEHIKSKYKIDLLKFLETSQNINK